MTLTNANQILYELIKQEAKKKGRKLKIICDWDECIQPLKPLAVYEVFKLQNNNLTFQDFFERFWEIAIVKDSFTSAGRVEDIEGTIEEKKAFEEYKKARELRRGKSEDYGKSFYSSPEWIKTVTEAPYLSLAEDLILALKEGNLIEELILISQFREGRKHGQGATRKRKNFPHFANFPQCKLELTELKKDEQQNEWIPPRWQRIKEICPEFDIFIDDSTKIISKSLKYFSDDKIYVMPDYKCNRHITGSNVYHIKTTVSDLKDEDFIKAAEEYKTKKKPQKNQQSQQKTLSEDTKTNYLPWIICGLVLINLIGIVAYFIFKEKKNKN